MIKIVYDPTNHWTNKGVDTRYIADKVNIIVYWALNSDWRGKLIDRIQDQYLFGWHPMQGFEIDEEGVMRYPGDPDLYPLLYIEQDNGKETDYLWFYNHDWITICDRDTRQLVTARVD